MAYKKHKVNNPGNPTMVDTIECLECPDHPDLLLLRDAAADEREAVAFYLEAAKNTQFTELFLDVAEDEMHHYVKIMRHISMLDPVQTAELKKQNLNILTIDRFKAKWQQKYCAPNQSETPPLMPSDKDIATIDYLTKALVGELKAINKYQKYMNKALTDYNKHLFCHLMNDEKEHVAEFTAALFELTHEPLPEEMD